MDIEQLIKLVEKLASTDDMEVDLDAHQGEFDHVYNERVTKAFKTAVETYQILNPKD